MNTIPLQKMKVLVACRGPIAKEALKVIQNLGMPAPDLIVSRYEWFDTLESRAPWLSDPLAYDRVHLVDEYSDMDMIVQVALRRKLDAIYVGYGFLAENADFGRLCEENDIRFVGPTSQALRLSGDKEKARRLCIGLGIPVIPGVELIELGVLFVGAKDERGAMENLQRRLVKQNIEMELAAQLEDALIAAMLEAQKQKKRLFEEQEILAAVEREISRLWKNGVFPVRIKASSGGGGKGQRVVSELDDVPKALREVWSEIGASKVGGSQSVILERNLEDARHLEVQILGDGENFVHFGVRDCSLQTMFYQKLIELALHEGQFERLKEEVGPESPLYRDFEKERLLLQSLQKDAIKLVKSTGYRGAGTVEFLVDRDYNYYFMEINARIQVEHGVSEEISRVRGKKPSLVGEQLKIAAGEKLDYRQEDIEFTGCSLETRISLLDSSLLQPAPGASIEHFDFTPGDGVRIEDSGIANALASRPFLTPPPNYDANLALNIYTGNSWPQVLNTAISNLRQADTKGEGLSTTIPFHLGVLTWLRHNQPFPRVTTRFVETYLCLLARLKRKLTDSIKKQIDEIVSRNKRKFKPWQTITSEVIHRICHEPNLVAAFFMDSKQTQSKQALETVYAMAKHACIPMWPEDKRYFCWATEFFRALSDLCQGLGIEYPANSLQKQALAKIIAKAENVSPEQAREALERRFNEYQEDITPLIEEMQTILDKSELNELKRNECSTLVEFPSSLAQASVRKKLLQQTVGETLREKGSVLSPILGMFYIYPKPNTPPFVKIGQAVQKGQTLCLVGAMKVYTEVQASEDGVIKEILASHDSLVTPGQKLMTLITE